MTVGKAKVCLDAAAALLVAEIYSIDIDDNQDFSKFTKPVTKRSTSTGCPTKTGIDMDTPEESRVSRSAKEGRIGPGGKT
jgi:hypothetical protein